MIVKLLTEHHLKFLSLKGGCRGLSQSTHVKIHIVGNLMHWLIYLYNCYIGLISHNIEIPINMKMH